MSIIMLAFIGGVISAISTGLGSILAPVFQQFEQLRRYQMSMDFALGVMLSAVAFSLVGPELIKNGSHFNIYLGLFLGAGFILITHKVIAYYSVQVKMDSQKMLLIAALIFHNLPEGMGAGASVVGLTLQEMLPIQMALSIQNIAEGLLLTLLLQGLGLNLFWSVIGGVFSGIIELTGAVTAGVFMQEISGLLPFFLALAGGAMMTSVLLEIIETYAQGRKIISSKFISGLLLIPVTNLLM